MTFGFMGLFGIPPISMVVIGAFPVLIGIGIDYAIQFQARFDEEIRRGTIPEAIRATITQMGPSVLIAMSATALGFIAMFFAPPVPMVADFGIVCTIGSSPVTLRRSSSSRSLRSSPVTGRRGRPPLSLEPNRRPGNPSWSGMTGSSVGWLMRSQNIRSRSSCSLRWSRQGGFYLDEKVPISSDEKTFVPGDMPALLSLEKITRTMGGSTSTIPVVVIADDVRSPETLAWIDRFGGVYEQEHNDKIIGVTSIATLIREYNDGGVLPSTEREVDNVTARIPEETLKRYLNGNMEAVLEFSTVDMEMSVARDLVGRMQGDVAWSNPPAGVTVKITGQLEMFAALMDDIADSKTFMTLLGFAFILGFMILVYRKFSAISPVIPIVFIVGGWNGAIMYLLGLDYTPLTAVLGSMTIGVASEYTILIMERCEEELARGVEFLDAIQIAVQKIGTAITASGMTTVFGFAALTISSFNIISNFGIVTVITVGFSLVGAIVVMPAVLALMYRFGGRSRVVAAAGGVPE